MAETQVMETRDSGRSSLAVFLTTLNALFLRELNNRFGARRYGYIWIIVEPAAQMAFMIVIFRTFLRGRGFAGSIYGVDALWFLALGVLPWLMFSHAVERCVGAMTAHQGLFNYRQIRPIDIIIVRVLIEFVIYAGVFLLVYGGGNLLGYDYAIRDLLPVVLMVVELFGFAVALALLFDVLTVLWPDSRRVWPLVMRALFFLSGVFYTIDAMPLRLRPYVIWNPLLHITDQIRGGALETYDSHANHGYVLLCLAVLLFVSLAMYRRYLHRLI